MVELRARLPSRPAREHGVPPADRLCLPFERRQKSRQRARLASGEEVAIDLPRGLLLRGGDWLLASDGRAIEVVAEAERLLHIECASDRDAARVAYHLGNRHVAVQVGEGWLRLPHDAVIERMVQGLGARTSVVDAPFEPEAGAYAAHHRHDNASGHGGRIHEFGDALAALAVREAR